MILKYCVTFKFLTKVIRSWVEAELRKMAIALDRIVRQNEMSILTPKTNEFGSFAMSYPAYKILWTPADWEELLTILEPGNIEDKFPYAVMKKEVLLGHQPKGKISCFLRCCNSNSESNWHGNILRRWEGMKVLCKLFFLSEIHKFISS